jgi:hypothetical protein
MVSAGLAGEATDHATQDDQRGRANPERRESGGDKSDKSDKSDKWRDIDRVANRADLLNNRHKFGV